MAAPEVVTLNSGLQGQLYTPQLCNNWYISGCFTRWDSPSVMCYLINQWIVYNLPIDLIDAQVFIETIYITSLYMCLLAVHVKILQLSIQSGWLHHRLPKVSPHKYSKGRVSNWSATVKNKNSFWSEFSVPQIEYPLEGSCKKCSPVYILLIDSCYSTTIVTSDCTIVTSGHHGSIRTFISNNSTIMTKQ